MLNCKNLVCTTLVCLALASCGGSSSPTTNSSNEDLLFVNGYFRTEYTFENFATGVNDSVTAVIGDDDRNITEFLTRSDGTSFTVIHDLDELGRLVERSRIENDGTTVQTETYSYNSNGLPDIVNGILSDNSTRRDILEWTADNKLDLASRTNSTADGVDSNFTSDFVYENGLLVSMRRERVPNTSGSYVEFTYSLDVSGRVVGRITTNYPEGEFVSRVAWEYDENGNQKTETVFDENETIQSRITTTYQPTDRKVYNRNLFLLTVLTK